MDENNDNSRSSMSGSMNTHDDQKIALTISNSSEQQIDLDCKEEFFDTSNEQSTEDNTSIVGTMNEDSRRNDDCIGNEVPTTGQYYEQQHEHNFEAMTTSSAPLQEVVGSKQDGSQDTTNTDVDGIILKDDDSSISIPSADELRNGNIQKEKIETTSSLPEAGNDTTVQNNNTTDTVINETIKEENTPLTEKKKKVSFAPINKLKQFDSKCIVSSSLQVHESNVELLASHSGNQRRRPVKRILRHTRLRLVPSVGLYKALMKSEEINDDTDELLYPSITDSIYSDSTSTQNKQSVGKRNTIQVALLHSHSHTQILYEAMKYIHQDRDLLLEALLKWCGILHGASTGGALSSFLRVVPPLVGTRKLLETFHSSDYLDVLEYVPQKVKEESATVESTQQQSLTDETDHSISAAMNEDSSGDHQFSSEECTSPTNDSNTADMSDHQSTFTSQTKFYETPFSPPPPEDESSYIDIPSQEILEKYGLEDDCPYPTSSDAHALLWKYCLACSGGSWHAASLLTSSEELTDVAIHWGGGRHHAHASKASGFCYISDVILAIHRLLQGNDKQIDTGMLVHKSTKAKAVQRNVSFRRVLYIDIDIHHGDGVQEAFYATDKVLTASFHRYSPGFFPSSTGSTTEKGEAGTSGLGYNVNIPLPAGIGDVQFIQIYRKCLFGLVEAYDPQVIVLCVGADGLEGDELISGCLDDDMTTTGDGWSLSPEGLAECVRIATALCAGQSEDEICVAPTAHQQQEEKVSEDDTPIAESSTKTEAPKQIGKRRKLLILGGGGYVSLECS